MKENEIHVAITGSTGIAAVNIGGKTIHSWSGIGIETEFSPYLLTKIRNGKKASSIRNAKVLILDEVSMLHKKQIDLVDLILKEIRNNGQPFGGIQVVLVGDGLQLPPIDKPNVSSEDKFFFMSNAWINGNFNICYLTEVIRQKDQLFVDILNSIRNQTIDGELIQPLLNTNANVLKHNPPLRLCCHNIDVDRLNQVEIDKLTTPSYFYYAELTGKDELKEVLRKNVLAPEKLELKVGMRVMFLNNDPEGKWVNGTQGSVSQIGNFINNKYSGDMVYVDIDNGETVVVSNHTWSINEDKSDEILASYNQIPLRPSYCITVNKSQRSYF